MDKQFKIPSLQNPVAFSASENLVDFEIPAGEVYDMSKSYVSFNARVSGVDAQADANLTTAIYNVSGVINNGVNTDGYEQSISLVKHASLHSAAKGRVEELRNVNLFRYFEHNIYEDRDEHLGLEYHGFQSIKNYEDFGNISPLVDIATEDGQSSRYIDKTFKIPMSHILNVGKVKEFDTRRLGKCNLKLELDMSRLSSTDDNYVVSHYVTNKNGQLVDVAAPGANTGLTSAVLGVGGAAKIYDDDYQEHIPFYIGQAVVVHSGTMNGNNKVNEKVVISNISYNSTNGQVTLSFGGPADGLGTLTPGSGGSQNLILIPANKQSSSGASRATTSTISVSQAELRLYSLGGANVPASTDELQYTKYTLEKDFGGGATSFKRKYEVEPNAVNVALLPRISDIQPDRSFESYRNAIDNELTTDRDVVPYTPLYFHRLNMYNLNQGREAQSVMGLIYFRNLTTLTNQSRGTLKSVFYVVEPLPITQNNKFVEFEIECAAGLNNFSLYKEVVASI